MSRLLKYLKEGPSQPLRAQPTDCGCAKQFAFNFNVKGAQKTARQKS
jgi:hypothetical protein